MSCTVDYVIEYEGKRLPLFSGRKRHSTLILWLRFQPPHPSPPHYVCTFSLFVALFLPSTPIPKPTVTLSYSVTTCQTSSHYSWNNGMLESFSLYLWRIIWSGSTSSLERDSWFGSSVLVSFLRTFFCTSGLAPFIIELHWLTEKTAEDMVSRSFQIDACCMGWVLCHRHLCSALECAGLAQPALILLHWLQLSHCGRGVSDRTVCCVWEPQFWIAEKLP